MVLVQQNQAQTSINVPGLAAVALSLFQDDDDVDDDDERMNFNVA